MVIFKNWSGHATTKQTKSFTEPGPQDQRTNYVWRQNLWKVDTSPFRRILLASFTTATWWNYKWNYLITATIRMELPQWHKQNAWRIISKKRKITWYSKSQWKWLGRSQLLVFFSIEMDMKKRCTFTRYMSTSFLMNWPSIEDHLKRSSFWENLARKGLKRHKVVFLLNEIHWL